MGSISICSAGKGIHLSFYLRTCEFLCSEESSLTCCQGWWSLSNKRGSSSVISTKALFFPMSPTLWKSSWKGKTLFPSTTFSIVNHIWVPISNELPILLRQRVAEEWVPILPQLLPGWGQFPLHLSSFSLLPLLNCILTSHHIMLNKIPQKKIWEHSHFTEGYCTVRSLRLDQI